MAAWRGNARKNLHVTDLPYKLSSWTLDDLNGALWLMSGRLAWACCKRRSDIDYVCRRTWSGIAPANPGLGDQRARGRPPRRMRARPG
jgi:hypothetical protein